MSTINFSHRLPIGNSVEAQVKVTQSTSCSPADTVNLANAPPLRNTNQQQTFSVKAANIVADPPEKDTALTNSQQPGKQEEKHGTHFCERSSTQYHHSLFHNLGSVTKWDEPGVINYYSDLG